eukprot:6084614-Prymnesium_polylepis.3
MRLCVGGALKVIDCLALDVISQCAPSIVERLQSSDRGAEQTAGSHVLAEHTCSILARFEDSVPEVRQAAVQTLGFLELPVLSTHTLAITQLVINPGPYATTAKNVTLTALRVMGKLGSADIAPHAMTLMHAATSSHADVLHAAMAVIERIDPKQLVAHGRHLADWIGCQEQSRRLLGLRVLSKLVPEDLVPHAPLLVALLCDSDEKLRVQAAEVLGRWQLLPITFISRVADENGAVRTAAVRSLCRLDPSTLTVFAPYLFKIGAGINQKHSAEAAVLTGILTVLTNAEPSLLAEHAVCIIPWLNHVQREVRDAALHVLDAAHELVTHSCRIAMAVQGLENAARRPDSVDCLWNAGRVGDHIAALGLRLDHEDVQVRIAAITVLVRVGCTWSAPFAAAVAHLLCHTDASVREPVFLSCDAPSAAALKSLAGEAVVSEQLAKPDEQVRALAEQALA